MRVLAQLGGRKKDLFLDCDGLIGEMDAPELKFY